MEKIIYLDNAATTKTAPEVVAAMTPYFSEHYGNPSSIYGLAAQSKEGVEQARKEIADVIGARQEEIYFNRRRHRGGQLGADCGGGGVQAEGKPYYYEQNRTPRDSPYVPVSGKARDGSDVCRCGRERNHKAGRTKKSDPPDHDSDLSHVCKQ